MADEKVPLSGDAPMIRLTTPRCMLCGLSSEVVLTVKEFAMLIDPSQPNIADVLPDRDLDFRELVKSGIHPDCWDTITKPLDGEDES